MNEKINEIIEFFSLREGWDKDELINDWLGEIKELKGYSADEIGLEWDERYLMTLQEFVDIFFEQTICGVCNVLESYKE